MAIVRLLNDSGRSYSVIDSVPRKEAFMQFTKDDQASMLVWDSSYGEHYACSGILKRTQPGDFEVRTQEMLAQE